MLQIATQIIHRARHMRHIMRLVIALQKARPKTDETQRTLGPKHGISGTELLLVEAFKLCLGAGDIEREHGLFACHRHILAGILQERHNVISARADQRVLKIDQADAAGALIGQIILGEWKSRKNNVRGPASMKGRKPVQMA